MPWASLLCRSARISDERLNTKGTKMNPSNWLCNYFGNTRATCDMCVPNNDILFWWLLHPYLLLCFCQVLNKQRLKPLKTTQKLSAYHVEVDEIQSQLTHIWSNFLHVEFARAHLPMKARKFRAHQVCHIVFYRVAASRSNWKQNIRITTDQT